MELWMLITIAIIAGLFMGLLTNYLFKLLPDSWLQDYGVKTTDPDYRPSKRMKMVPHGIIAVIICITFYVFSVIYSKCYFDTHTVLRLINITFLAPLLVLIMMSDRLNRIIPDQFSIGIAVLGLLALICDYKNGTIWFSVEAKWYMPLLNRLLAAIVGGGFLWLIGFVSETFLGKEAMGQGDMKLLSAIGLLTGSYGMVVVIYGAVFSALIFAIPLMIRKQIRLNKEEEIIKNSPNPAKKRREIALEKSRIHFADDPDYLAFGPFLAFGAAIFVAAEPFWFQQMQSYMYMLGVLF